MTSVPDTIQPGSHLWQWQGFSIRYQSAGDAGKAASPDPLSRAALVLIHGFGASSDHWRHNLPVLGQTYRVYALDLIGFGLSAKPQPGSRGITDQMEYTFEAWGEQVIDFLREVVGTPAFLIGNSIGCIVALQATVIAPSWVLGVAMLNCSLRLLHERKRSRLPWHRRFSAPLLQAVLGNRQIGHFFFQKLATPPSDSEDFASGLRSP
ncbi:alpha/beta fold hydrolase [Neosynechococcus sphagnicola]|uniref:alpha/beta fold hydrolase n=1 Tax=Neosynechococcus sphagnicola TaxID=1501145 RepID=UPI000AC19A87